MLIRLKPFWIADWFVLWLIPVLMAALSLTSVTSGKLSLAPIKSAMDTYLFLTLGGAAPVVLLMAGIIYAYRSCVPKASCPSGLTQADNVLLTVFAAEIGLCGLFPQVMSSFYRACGLGWMSSNGPLPSQLIILGGSYLVLVLLAYQIAYRSGVPRHSIATRAFSWGVPIFTRFVAFPLTVAFCQHHEETSLRWLVVAFVTADTFTVTIGLGVVADRLRSAVLGPAAAMRGCSGEPKGEAATCKVCGAEAKDELIVCPSCLTPHHTECWKYAKGCSTFGCEFGPVSR